MAAWTLIIFLAQLAAGAGQISTDDLVREPLARLKHLTSGVAECSTDEQFLIVKQLAELGEPAVAAIVKELCERPSESTAIYRRRLTDILGRIRGKVADRALLDLYFYHQGEGEVFDMQVRAALERREITCPVPEHEVSKLCSAAAQRDDLHRALDATLILSQASRLPVETRLMPAKELLYDLMCFSASAPDIFVEMQIRHKAFWLRGIMLAARNAGTEGRDFWKQLLKAAETDEQRLWLNAALGMAGDPDVAVIIRKAIDDEQDEYLRAVLVEAYGGSAKKEAVPFLKQLLHESAVPAEARQPAGFEMTVEQAARSELLRLERLGRGKMR